MKIKTRFAPSPTGNLHLGGVRTALYNWLFARSLNGKFILRIEDTDINRSKKNQVKDIIDNIKWLNLLWDDEPYFQSERLDHYNEIINHMLKSGMAYKCFCSEERLQNLRSKQIIKKQKPRYDEYCRYNQDILFNKNQSYVIRFCNPKNELVEFNDYIRGKIIFKNNELDDFIIKRTNGMPTYNFCSVVDDLDMNITHVIRGEEHINNTPRQINLFRALGAPIPIYAHLPILLGSDGKKLSKRQNATSIVEYKNDGFLPEALLNYLLKLGWSYGNQEIFSLNEMKKLFNLNKITKSSAIFDIKKLKWFNHHYINTLPEKYILKQLNVYIKKEKINIENGPKLSEVLKILSVRSDTLKEIAISCKYFYTKFLNFNNEAKKKYLNKKYFEPLKLIYCAIKKIDMWEERNIHAMISKIAHSSKTKIHDICMPLRVAITGMMESPKISHVIYLIGKEKTLQRIKSAIKNIENN